MEAGLMKVVQCLNISWTHNCYFIIRRPVVQLIIGGNVSIPLPHVVFLFTISSGAKTENKFGSYGIWVVFHWFGAYFYSIL